VADSQGAAPIRLMSLHLNHQRGSGPEILAVGKWLFRLGFAREHGGDYSRAGRLEGHPR